MTTKIHQIQEYKSAKQSDSDQNELLKVENLSIRFKTDNKNTVTAVNNVSFELKKSETVAIVGESGCGKSITSLSIMGLIPKHAGYVEGSIRLNGKELNGLSGKQIREIRGRDISMIFQEPMTSLNPVHKIGKQIGEVLELHSSLSKKEIRNKTIDMLKKVGIPRPEKIIDEYPHQLSGGMRQRVMIAMAMACNPKLLIADEPTTALDVTIQAQILDLMNDLKTLFQTTILLITHDLGVVAEVADRVIVMYYGQIVEEADVISLFASPKHPYTRGLLNSIPSLEEKRSRLKPIEGNVPNLGDITQGCPFRLRCQDAIGKCAEENPPLFLSDQTRKVRCWLYEEGEVSV
ncbi:ABC transporter ATP-binding protein [Anaerobacillus alkaliphilus]|uniref:ABC transporter ATP-binding protein n=1 Tax=Anaerobacillus alkaliphilus TaxID=1548597 RepID=A0A4Q0VMI8_9BACI|nr:ABC transporter ATP-binding protein [Anaerobacillus alkaliphilus]RXI96176.1 ABC transporter ATP-binding protein [Anaerobacillus alkaliphilus]